MLATCMEVVAIISNNEPLCKLRYVNVNLLALGTYVLRVVFMPNRGEQEWKCVQH